MKLSLFSDSWDAARKTNRLLVIAVICLAASNLMLGGAAVSRKTTVVLVPPEISEKFEVAVNAANSAYYQSWALYLANILGNVTPSNMGMIEEAIGPFLSEELYPRLIGSIRDELDGIRRAKVSTYFRPERIESKAGTSVFEVTGQHVVVSPAGAETSTLRTYIFHLAIRQGRPFVTGFDVTNGRGTQKKDGG